MKHTILFFGSFNPIHNGHLAIASWVVGQRGLCDELWMVVSPGNPLKDAAELADARQRLETVRRAVEAAGCAGSENGPAEEADGGERVGEGRSARQSATRRTLSATCPELWRRVKVCDVEFHMPRPSYTIDTLERLGREFPERKFALLVGSDIIGQLDRWKDHLKLLERYRVLVYPRPGYPVSGPFAGKVTLLEDAPQWNDSSTEVRKAIAEHMQSGKSHYRMGEMDAALNDFVHVRELDPGNTEAEEYVKIISEIFEFRYSDIYNP